MMQKISVPLVSLVVFLAVIQVDESLADDWQYTAELYALAADVSATSAAGEEINADFDDIVDDLEFAMFGSLAATRDRLTLFGNLFYVDTEARERNNMGPLSITAEVGLENIVSTFGAGWALHESDTSRVNVLGGARYLSMDVDVKLEILPLGRVNESKSESNWDGVIGVQGTTDLSERWYLNYYLDIGTGDSDRTWQASAGINYRFDSWDLVLGYQHLEWEFDDQLLEDLEMSGPAIGVKFHF